jgi:hypothetical protein
MFSMDAISGTGNWSTWSIFLIVITFMVMMQYKQLAGLKKGGNNTC